MTDLPGEEKRLLITQDSANYLNEISGWGKFMGIVGFVFTAFMVCFSVFMGSMWSSINGATGRTLPISGFAMGVLYFLIALVYFFPSYYLYLSAIGIKKALVSKDNEVLAGAMSNMKSLYKFMGITTVILLGLYALIAVFGIGAALFAR